MKPRKVKKKLWEKLKKTKKTTKHNKMKPRNNDKRKLRGNQEKC
jgi:hypothetical protein